MFSNQLGKFLKMQQHLGAGPHHSQDDEPWPIPPGLHTSGELGRRIHMPRTRDMSLQRVHMHRKAQPVRTSEELPRCHQRLETPEAAEQVSPFSFHYTWVAGVRATPKQGSVFIESAVGNTCGGAKAARLGPGRSVVDAARTPVIPRGAPNPGGLTMLVLLEATR